MKKLIHVKKHLRKGKVVKAHTRKTSPVHAAIEQNNRFKKRTGMGYMLANQKLIREGGGASYNRSEMLTDRVSNAENARKARKLLKNKKVKKHYRSPDGKAKKWANPMYARRHRADGSFINQ